MTIKAQTPPERPDREDSIKERLDRLAALEDWRHVIEALQLAVSALGYITEVATVPAARSTASGALLGIEKELTRADGAGADSVESDQP